MNKTVVVGVILFFIVLFGFNFISNKPSDSQMSLLKETPTLPTSTNSQIQIINKQAVFAIFTNGTFRIFTDSRYHNLSEDLFIQADNPNIVHVKKLDATWDDFFKTLPMSLSNDCLTTGTNQTFCTNQNSSLKFYLNGGRVDDLLNQEIKDGDKVLISYGNESETQIVNQINKLLSLSSNQ